MHLVGFTIEIILRSRPYERYILRVAYCLEAALHILLINRHLPHYNSVTPAEGWILGCKLFWAKWPNHKRDITSVLRKWIRRYWDGTKTPVLYVVSLDSKLLSYIAGRTGSCTPNVLWRHCRRSKQRALQINLLNLMNHLADWIQCVPKLRVFKRRTRLDQIIHTDKTENGVNWRRSNACSSGDHLAPRFATADVDSTALTATLLRRRRRQRKTRIRIHPISERRPHFGVFLCLYPYLFE